MIDSDGSSFLYPLDLETARKPVARRNEILQRSSREEILFLEERVRPLSMRLESLGDPMPGQYWSDDGCLTLPAKQIGDPNPTATRWRCAFLMAAMSQEAQMSQQRQSPKLPGMEELLSTQPTANPTPTELYCDVSGCAAPFSGRYAKGNLARHKKYQHTNEHADIEFPCEEAGCDSTFKRKDARLKHYRMHHPEFTTGPAQPRKR
jgi:hypothetical protein